MAAVFRNDVGANGEPRTAGGIVDETWIRLIERDDQRVGVGGAKADGGEIVELAGDEGARVFHPEEQAGLGGGGGGGECAAVGIDEMGGGDGFTVGPAGLRAEVKRVEEAVRREFEAVRRAG